jgi:tetratricopeptide (TPR) repeat protein
MIREVSTESSLAQTLVAFACGRYHIARVLGSGGEKVVYLVHDGTLDRDCALSVLHPSAQSEERLLQEARAIARLGSHPHIVTVFDVGEHDRTVFVVSEHMAGGDLRAELDKTGTLDATRVRDIAVQLLRALAFVHERDLVHRDIKPDNIWLTDDGTVKLGDFGIALAPQTGPSGGISGTPLYMAPEQLRGDRIDGRADLYALGCVLYELLTGAPPFGGSLAAVIDGHLKEDAPPVSARNPNASSFDAFVRALLAKDPSQRPATAMDALRLLDDQSPQPKSQPAGDWSGPVQSALARDDVPGAVKILRDHLARRADPEARFVLANVHFFFDPEASRLELERVLDEFTEANLPKRAAMVAARLGFWYMSAKGNIVAARPWFARARRLVAGEGPCVERGWVALADVACNVDDPAELRLRAETALEMARRFGDKDLEIKALADCGLALTHVGHIAEGMSMLDEAMAIITSGGVRNRLIVGQSVCSFFTACSYTSDLARCEAWTKVLRERKLVADTGTSIISSHCHSVYGGLLCSLGRLKEAESHLVNANVTVPAQSQSGQLHVLSALAELRISQGRLDEAATLLEGRDDHMEALIPSARLHLARGAWDLAISTARRGLRRMGSDRTRAVRLFCVLVLAELGRGDLDAAQAACESLDERLAGVDVPALHAEAACARARVHAAKGDRERAIEELEEALLSIANLDLAMHKARLHVALARLHAASDRVAAAAEARAASAICARVGVVLPDDDATFVRALQ